MAIIVDSDTRLVVQGLTGREGSFHGVRNRDYGTNVVAGVTPGKGGQDVEGIPVFDTVAEAVAEAGANTSMVFVPARFATDAIYEAVDAGHRDRDLHRRGAAGPRDAARLQLHPAARASRCSARTAPARSRPGKANVGIIPAEIFREGRIGLVSRSGTLTYQIGHELTQLGLGNSTIVGIGGDPVVGSAFIDVLGALRGRRGDRGRRHGRRDRRRRGGEGRRVHRGRDVEARRRLHRRLHRAARQDDGPRRRDHLRHRPVPRRRRRRRSRPGGVARSGDARRREVALGSSPPDVAARRRAAWNRAPVADIRPRRRSSSRRMATISLARGRSGAGVPAGRGARRVRPRGRASATGDDPHLRARPGATRRCAAAGSPSGTASTPARVVAHERVAPGLRAPRRSCSRRGGERVLVEAPTYDRPLKILGALGAEVVPRAGATRRGSTSRRSSRSSRRGRGPRFSTRSRPSRTRAAGRCRSTRAVVSSSSPRARPARARGRPVRRRPVRGRGAADALRARRREGGRLLVARSPRSSRPESGSGTSSCPSGSRARSEAAAASTYISPALLAQATVHEFLRRGQLERNLELVRSLLRREAGCDAGRPRRALAAPARAGAGPRAAISSGSTSRAARTSGRLLARRARESASSFVAGPDFYPWARRRAELGPAGLQLRLAGAATGGCPATGGACPRVACGRAATAARRLGRRTRPSAPSPRSGRRSR